MIVDDSSDFETELQVRGVIRHGYRILEVHGPVVPNTIASVLLHIRDVTGLMPHIYFRWTEGNPVINFLRFLFLGEGEIAPVTREVLREAVPDVTQRRGSTSADYGTSTSSSCPAGTFSCLARVSRAMKCWRARRLPALSRQWGRCVPPGRRCIRSCGRSFRWYLLILRPRSASARPRRGRRDRRH